MSILDNILKNSLVDSDDENLIEDETSKDEKSDYEDFSVETESDDTLNESLNNSNKQDSKKELKESIATPKVYKQTARKHTGRVIKPDLALNRNKSSGGVLKATARKQTNMTHSKKASNFIPQIEIDIADHYGTLEVSQVENVVDNGS